MADYKRQDYLDKFKYFASEKAQDDLSGTMNYCYLCPNCDNGRCTISQELREKYNICALMDEFTLNEAPWIVDSLVDLREQKQDK